MRVSLWNPPVEFFAVPDESISLWSRVGFPRFDPHNFRGQWLGLVRDSTSLYLRPAPSLRHRARLARILRLLNRIAMRGEIPSGGRMPTKFLEVVLPEECSNPDRLRARGASFQPWRQIKVSSREHSLKHAGGGEAVVFVQWVRRPRGSPCEREPAQHVSSASSVERDFRKLSTRFKMSSWATGRAISAILG